MFINKNVENLKTKNKRIIHAYDTASVVTFACDVVKNVITNISEVDTSDVTAKIFIYAPL